MIAVRPFAGIPFSKLKTRFTLVSSPRISPSSFILPSHQQSRVQLNLQLARFNSSLTNKNSNNDELKHRQAQNNQLTPEQKRDASVSRQILESQVRQHIPGETPQTNTISDRIPRFPFTKDTVPTLIPRPNVPKAGSNLFKMAQTLKTKEAPELIYESESHRLYFVFCGAFALVCTIYGLLFLEWAASSAYDIYVKNEDDLPFAHNFTMWWARNAVTLLIFAFPAGLAALFMTIPTRLIRRIWYIPSFANELKNNPEPLVRFTSHPFLPGRPTPVHTMPLSMLNRSYKSKIFTNNGFYLTLDKGSFLFMLKEGSKKIPWIVDRKGFFWGDGRLFDHLFGKESIEEADLGISYDDKFGAINQKLKQDIGKLKEEKGPAWQFKEQGRLMKEDIKSLANKIKTANKALNAGKESDAKAKKLPNSPTASAASAGGVAVKRKNKKTAKGKGRK